MDFKKISYYTALTPFKYNFFIILFISSLGFWITKSSYYQNDLPGSTQIILNMSIKLFWIFASIILLISFGTLLTTWFYLRFLKSKKKGSLAKINFGVDGFQASAGRIPFSISFNNLIRPLLGIIKSRLLFDDFQISQEIQLVENLYTKSQIFRSAVFSAQGIYLTDRKKYNIKKIVVFYEDMFRLFSLPLVIPFERPVYTIPPNDQLFDQKISPNKTTEQTIKIETLQKAQGELFNYKNFESGDDIRRIVWKIFAKNRELVIRVPEIIDPHASEIELYTSFHNSISKEKKSRLFTYLSNSYKDKLRIVYETAKHNGYNIIHKPDQTIDQSLIETSDQVLYNISLSDWQTEIPLNEYLGKNKSAIVCISSLISHDDLEKTIQKSTPSQIFFFIKLSKTFKNKSSINFLNIVLRTEKNRDTLMKQIWLFSPLKSKMKRNEKEIEAVLNSQNVKFHTI